MKKVILSTAIAAMFISFNANADISWDGFYAGVTAGGIKNDEGAKEKSAFTFEDDGGWIDYRGELDSETVTDNILEGLPTNQSFDTEGAIYGLSLGFNKQFNRIVLGIEADFSGSNADGEKTSTLPIYSYPPFGDDYVAGSASTTSSSEMDWFSTARIRAGFLATPSTLLYVTGGAAWAKAKASVRTVGQHTIGGSYFPNQHDQFDAKSSDSETLSGWAAGIGIEHKITQNWSFKGEWIHYDLGDIKVTNTIYDNGSTSNGLDYTSKTNKFEFEGDALKLGINYAF